MPAHCKLDEIVIFLLLLTTRLWLKDADAVCLEDLQQVNDHHFALCKLHKPYIPIKLSTLQGRVRPRVSRGKSNNFYKRHRILRICAECMWAGDLSSSNIDNLIMAY